jgi:hypothetical protein
MAKPKESRRKIQITCFILFCIGMIPLIIFRSWWPGIALTFGFPIALREYLLGKKYDSLLTLAIFSGIFVTVQFDIAWNLLLPVLFTIAAVYIFFRDFFGVEPITEEEEELEINEELQEEKKEKH